MSFCIDKNGLDMYREQTVNDIIQLLDVYDKVACNRYTGFGKSYYIVPQLIKRLNSKVIIVVPSTPLLQQYKEYFKDNKDVQIITYQIIKNIETENILGLYAGFKYIICDECHHLGKNKWKKELNRFNSILKAKIIGLTATPVRGDSINVIESYFNNIQVEPLELIDGISLGFLPKIKYVVAYAEVEDKYDIRMNEIDRYKIENLLNVSNILKKHIGVENLQNNPKMLVYVPNIKYIDEAVEQCKKWFSEFEGYNINIYDIHSYKDIKENYEILDEFKVKHTDNTIDIMVSVDMITEGLHLPNISVEIMLRKTQSPVKYFQQLGRVINNKQPIVFDLINNSRHLYQMKKEYTLNTLNSSIDRKKVMFDECIELYDETKDVLDILKKYHDPKRIDDIIRLYILNDIKSGMMYQDVADKYNISVHTVAKILREFNYKRIEYLTDAELLEIYDKNKEFILDSNGKLSRPVISKKLGLGNEKQIERIYRLKNIKMKRMYEPVKKSQHIKDEFIKLYNLYNKSRVKSIIQRKLNLTDREYSSYLRDEYVRDKIILKGTHINEDEEQRIKMIISQNLQCNLAELSRLCNRSTTSIKLIINKYKLNVKGIRPYKPLSKKDELNIIESYKEFGSLNGVSKALGFHKNTIKKVLLKHRYKINGATNDNKHPLSEQEMLNIYSDYMNGMLKKDLRSKYHRADSSIYKAIKFGKANN